MLFTLDASVIVAALRTQEATHAKCLALLTQIAAGDHRAVQPLTVLVEVVAAIRRRTGSGMLAERIERELLTFPNMEWVELDRARAESAATMARETGVRGMDAIVIAIAKEFGSVLVTLDTDIQQRASDQVTISPVQDVLSAPNDPGH